MHHHKAYEEFFLSSHCAPGSHLYKQSYPAVVWLSFYLWQMYNVKHNNKTQSFTVRIKMCMHHQTADIQGSLSRYCVPRSQLFRKSYEHVFECLVCCVCRCLIWNKNTQVSHFWCESKCAWTESCNDIHLSKATSLLCQNLGSQELTLPCVAALYMLWCYVQDKCQHITIHNAFHKL